MQIVDDTNHLLKLFFILVLIITIAYIIANLVEQEQLLLVENWYATDILFVIIPIIAIIFGAKLSLTYKGKGDHGIAWILFTMAMTVWFTAELTYSYEIEYDVNDITTFLSDILYLTGYPLFLGFTIFYLKPRKKSISKQIVFGAIIISSIFVIPTLFISINFEDEPLYIFIYSAYPILDSIILIPSIIAVTLFFKGKVNFLWILILFSTILDIIADSTYLVESIEESFDPSHPLNILYITAYLCYVFGAYSHMKLFKRS